MATISAAFAVELAELHKQHGVAYVAAPVLGRPDVAAAAKLNILAAGADADIGRVQPVFDVLGQETWRVGHEPQHANVLKLAANFMLASAIEAFGEAAALVDGHGLPAQTLLDVITNSLFPGPVYAGYGKMIAERRYEPAMFKARLGLKDVRLAIAAGDAVNVPLPVASVVRDKPGRCARARRRREGFRGARTSGGAVTGAWLVTCYGRLASALKGTAHA